MTAPQRSDPARSSGSTAASGAAGPGNGPTTSPPAGAADPAGDAQTAGHGDFDLLAALLDGMDAALCAFDAEGTVTHWNREAERVLGWPPAEAIGRRGLAGWALRASDAPEVEAQLLGARRASGRQVHEFALVTKGGGRVLVRAQTAPVPTADGAAAGVYCAFSEVHAQIDLERSIALSEALFDDASWGVVLVDADLRPAVLNGHAARSLGAPRAELLGRPLGDLIDQGVEEVESAFQHVLAEGAPPEPTEIWVTVRGERAAVGQPPQRRCWRSGFLRLASPLTEEAVPLGVAWIFRDVTEAKRAEQESARMRFRSNQLHRAARAAAECEDPFEAATVYLDFALAGFADHALIDLVREPSPSRWGGPTGQRGSDGAGRVGRGDGSGNGSGDGSGNGVTAGAVGAAAGGGGTAGGAGAGPAASGGNVTGGAERFGDAAGVAGATGREGVAGTGDAVGVGEAGAADAGPAGYPPPGYGSSGHGTSGHGIPAHDASGQDASGHDAAAHDAAAHGAPDHGAAGPHPAGDGAALIGGPSSLPDRPPIALVRVVAAPAGAATGAGPSTPLSTADGIPVAYVPGHPALQAADRCGSVRASAGRTDEEGCLQWAAARKWPGGTVHGLCAVLRSRGRTLGVASFLRGTSRRAFDRTDAAYAEDVAVRVAAAIDLAQQLR
ncbi:PAS domain-containing protein [Streptomyces sp. 796.1]|uniref:PAS domain-containing protein n=1 Tax=Streptomyces sp. 796.1 TaxID=3163029 RepID=UPI0039C8EF4F